MSKYLKFVVVVFYVLATPAISDEIRIALSDDASRGELYEYGLATLRVLPRKFKFPKNVIGDHVYGIDVSHHNGIVDWSLIPASKIRFVYVKASQSIFYYDDKFERNWSEIEKLKKAGVSIARGAYHFLSANGDASKQAANFLHVIGRVEQGDLPPSLDLEWDLRKIKTASGKVIQHDQWDGIPSDQIISKVLTWLGAVKKGCGCSPIIYTNFMWWRSHIGRTEALNSYRVWVADYAAQSLEDEAPHIVPKGYSWLFWQLTDQATIHLTQAGALAKGFDASRFVGTTAEFDGQFGEHQP